MHAPRRLAPAFALFVLAPFVGEFLLGNLTLAELPLGLVLAPMYGCGALLVREVGRRSGGGWPTMVLLAAAYALIEEGPVDQLLWNDSYAGADLLHGPSYIPALGMSVELTQTVLALHTVWSVCVPIALVETLTRSRRGEPWLGRVGLAVVAVVFVAGGVLVFLGNYGEERFVASPWQLAGVCLAVVLLVAAAFAVRARRLPPLPGRAPAPWRAGLAALVVTSAYWGPANLITDDRYEWVGVGVWCAGTVLGVWWVSRWSRREGWGVRHRFTLAAGALLTYVWVSFPVRPESGGSVRADLVGNAVCGTLACLLLVWCARRTRVRPQERNLHSHTSVEA
ncbi:DUF998 domain-containing protein [Streptomyces albofaciens JCM 4342]|uniref:DUF998 domain-containing protein n=1 Tax=Streptomyces albofaciens TaxID=66866 RepID=UPI00123C35BD|nr:DUF998 domain-containing protein [Streptomyces albofaciens]KAA6223968.1 DUF998 domain-containing protein [Streptomyces albofaciens JCM 4342]